MSKKRLPDARWWTMRRAQSNKPSTYTCPICGRYLSAMAPHALIAPEGDMDRRRHAHFQCVANAGLPDYGTWKKTQPKPPSRLAHLFRRKG